MATPMDLDYTPDPVAASPLQDSKAQQLLQKLAINYEFKTEREVQAVSSFADTMERKAGESEVWTDHHETMTKEYREEGDRLGEQLEVIGIAKDTLDSEATTNMKLLASAAEILGCREAGSQELLLCWTDLVIDDIQHSEDERNLAGCISLTKKETEQARRVVSQIRSAVNMVNQKQQEAERFMEELNRTRDQSFAGAKKAEETTALNREIMATSGYDSKIQADLLMTQLDETKEERVRLEKLEKRKALFYDLPVDVKEAKIMLNNAKRHLQEVSQSLIGKRA